MPQKIPLEGWVGVGLLLVILFGAINMNLGGLSLFKDGFDAGYNGTQSNYAKCKIYVGEYEQHQYSHDSYRFNYTEYKFSKGYVAGYDQRQLENLSKEIEDIKTNTCGNDQSAETC